ncbi:hypothetical protein ACFQ3Z_43980 [Streptomyces nogalater]
MTRSRPDEERLSRLCFAASHFEEVKQAGLRPGNPLLHLGPGAVLDDLLGQVPDYVTDDIAGQVELAEADHALGWVTRQPVDRRLCAPVFSGSNDVDGADADFIVDGHLIDCKATTRPDRFGSKKEVYQLAGYLLLDYEDEYRLDKVCFYLSRQGRLVTWAQEFLGLLGARRTLPQLRSALRQVLRGAASLPDPGSRSRPPRRRRASSAKPKRKTKTTPTDPPDSQAGLPASTPGGARPPPRVAPPGPEQDQAGRRPVGVAVRESLCRQRRPRQLVL